jgi:predicted nucleotidyltransferase
MSDDLALPGSPPQQSLLRIIARLYTEDERVRAVLIYGSLGRDDWDAYSDLDLAVVVRDNVEIDMAGELERVSAALAQDGERVLFTEFDGQAGFVVVGSLTGIALDYDALKSIAPYVLSGWRLLCGSLEPEAVRGAAEARVRDDPPLSRELHRALWLALGADIALQRRQFWRALPWLDPLRNALVGIFAASRGGQRAYYFFEERASAALKAKFGRTFAQYFPDSPVDSARLQSDALAALLDLVEHNLDELSDGKLQLGPGEREVVSRLRARQTALRAQRS